MSYKRFTTTFLCFLLAACHSEGYKGPRSDHFDGETFYNTPPIEQRGFLDALKWWSSRTRVKWPTAVANQTYPPLQSITDANSVVITFINHATLLIQSKDYAILTDPIWSQRTGPFSWLGAKRVRAPGRSLEELPHINLVLLSHNHYDHMDIPTLQTLEKKYHPTFLVPLGNKTYLEKFGLTHVVELDWWQTYDIPKGVITFLPTQHWTARWLNDRNKTLWGSYGIQLANQRIYFGGDAGYSAHYQEIQAKWGSPDVAFLPIGAYKPRWFMKPFHLDPAEAVQAMQDLKAKQAVGIHFGTFQLGDEDYFEPMDDLNAAKQAAQLSKQAFFILDQGQSWKVGTPPPMTLSTVAHEVEQTQK